jgi:hypothetical protein
MYEALTWDINLDELPSATIEISIAPNITTVETSATPFVHFTAYEIEHKNSTETVQLSSVYVQPYWQKGIEHDTIATGPIPREFMNQIPQSACDAGNLQAVVTVIILVNMFYVNQPTFAPGIVHWESTALGWDDDPVEALDQSLSNLVPQVMTDWVLSDIVTKPTIVNVKPNQTPNPVPTTKTGGDNGFKAPPSVPSFRQTVGTIGKAPIVIGASSVVVVGSQTLRPGGPTVTVGGTPVALDASATEIIVGGSMLPLPLIQNPGLQQTVGTLGTVPVVLGPSSVVVIGTQTLQPGGAAVTVRPGTTVALAPSATALIIGGTTSLLPHIIEPAVQAPAPPAAQRPPPVLTIDSTTLVPNAATQFFIGPGQTLTPGGVVNVDGVKVSLDPSAYFVVIGSSTQILSAPGPASVKTINRSPELVFGGSTFTALPTDSSSDSSKDVNLPGSGPTFVIAGQTLIPGGTPITVSGTELSLAPSASFLVVDHTTVTIATPAAVVAAEVSPPPLTIDNDIFQPLPGTGTTYQIGETLLTPGGSVVVAGTTISLASGATALIVNGVTSTLMPQAQPIITNPPLLTVGTRTYTASPGTGTAFVIEGDTLTPGGTITVDGTTIVLSPQATELVYGSSGHSTSTVLFPATTTKGTSTSTASASQRQSGEDGQAVPTSTREGLASRPGKYYSVLLVTIGCLGWLLI